MEEEYDYESLGQSSTMAQNATAGALAGIAEHCLMYPVDSIKTRKQVLRPMVITNGGVAQVATRTAAHLATQKVSLWRGVNSVVMGAGPAHALHFATYEVCKEAFGANEDSTRYHFLAPAAAGACATLAHDIMMNPFDVIKQRMQLRETSYRTIGDCARRVYAAEGVTAFYISLPTTLVMSIPFQSIQFATYEFFRKYLNPAGSYDPKTHMVAGGLAGAFASSITCPLDVVKTLLQTRGQSIDPRIRNAAGLWDAVSIIHERHGYRGFFRGLKPRVLTQMPSAAISWSVYEYFKWFLMKKDSQQSLLSL
ncbi:Fe(2+) transporter [Umbelopsis sp. WA50703]